MQPVGELDDPHRLPAHFSGTFNVVRGPLGDVGNVTGRHGDAAVSAVIGYYRKRMDAAGVSAS